MPNTQLTKESIKKRIESRLGGGGVLVELVDQDYLEAIEDTIDIYNQARPRKLRQALPITTAQKRYVLRNADGTTNYGVDPNIAGIIHMEFITRRTQPSQVDPFDPFDTALAGVTLGSGSGETFGEIGQRLAYSEDASRVVDGEPDYEALWEGQEYVVYVDKVRDHIEASFEYSIYYGYEDEQLALIPRGDVNWILRYATARAKVLLGRQRNKFGGIANPDGSVDELEGSQLIDEGREEMRELEEELQRRRPPLGPVIE